MIAKTLVREAILAGHSAGLHFPLASRHYDHWSIAIGTNLPFTQWEPFLATPRASSSLIGSRITPGSSSIDGQTYREPEAE